MPYTRFAIYYVPPASALADFGAAWLGWDLIRGMPVEALEISGRGVVTASPRKYGFHGTLKPPFRLRDGYDAARLAQSVQELAACTAPVACTGLKLSRLGRFLALTPTGDTAALGQLASVFVTQLDAFRAPPTAQELAKRRQRRLSERQDANLERWGYPYVLDEFRFHLTLTGKLPKDQIENWIAVLENALPALPEPFEINSVALVGERADGQFELIERFDLSG
jgi:putative phosphonate metabolism protein